MYTDKELILSIRTGDSHLLKFFYEKNYPIVAHYIKQNSGKEEDAQDIFQESITLLVYKVKETDFKLTSSLSTYLFSIAKNCWLKHLRDSKYMNMELFDNSKHDVEIPVDKFEVTLPENKLLGWLTQITKHCQQILKAIFFLNEPIEKIMIKMRWKNKHTAFNQKYKCIQQLKKIKEKDEYIL